MRPVTHLPSKPLEWREITVLNDTDRLWIVPYGGIPEGDGVQVYAIKIATGDAAHALGFDEARSQWQRIASVEATDLAAADNRLNAVLDEWVKENYGGRFELLEAR